LDEGDTQIQVCQVTAHQTQAEGNPNRDDSSKVYATSHLDLLSAVKEGGRARQDLRHDGREDEMPCCQENGVIWRTLAKVYGL
jgi:hypothetical protein